MRCGIAVVLAFVAAAAVGEIDPAVRAVMTQHWRFTSDDFADLQAGKVVKHANDGSAPGEVAAAGAIRIRTRRQVFLDRLRDIVNFKRAPDVIEIGRFSNPPTLRDLDGLTVTKDDFDVDDCKVHDCDVRLPADVIDRFRREIDPHAPDAATRTAALFKQVLLDNVIAYETGDARGRLLAYDDGDRPIRPADEFDGVLRDSPALVALAPSLPDHFRQYPAGPIAADEDFLYWSKEKFGIAPFITVTHVTIVCPSARTCVVATRDVYSSRYIDASLSITVATDAEGVPDTFYLIFANRSRANALKGGLAGLRRALATRRARASIEDNLKRIRRQLESGLASR